MSPCFGSCLRLRLCVGLSLCVGLFVPAYADGSGEWFRTAEQRAAARWAEGEHEALAAEAPDARWEALGRYGTGDHGGAADAFARALEDGDERPASERDALRFGQATAATRAGRLDEALSLYDELLAADPDDVDARHNRDIARALQEIEERETPPEGGGSDPSEESSSGEGEEDEAAEQDGQEGQDGTEGGQEDERNEGRQAAGDGEERPEAGESSSANADEDSEEAGGRTCREVELLRSRPARARSVRRRRLAARRHRRREPRARRAGGARGARRRSGAAGRRRWVRRGRRPAMNPAKRRAMRWRKAGWRRARASRPPSSGFAASPTIPPELLRARLLQTHRDDYPEVGDGDEPW